jgi:hypothetical protein
MFACHVPGIFVAASHRLRHVAIVLAGLALGACTIALEPAFNQAIVDEVETLAKESESFFVTIEDGIPLSGFAARSKVYEALTARAATIRLYAEARPAPEGRLPGLFNRLFAAATPPGLAAAPDAADGDRGASLASAGERYANATSGFMDDYLRNLKKLRDRDAEAVAAWVGDAASFEAAEVAYAKALQDYIEKYQAWLSNRGPRPNDLGKRPQVPQGGVSRTQVALRVLVMRDVLRDALFYERDVLNRNR